MKNLIKYGCYTLLAVAVFTAFWLMGGFISMEFDVSKWEFDGRFLVLSLTVCVVALVIGFRETA